MFENHNQLFSLKGLRINMHQNVVTLGTNKICLFLSTFWLITQELQDKNDINLVLLMQKLYGYQIKVISVF